MSFLVHPDYVIESRARSVYRCLLDYLRQLRSSEQLWFALPSEVDEWCRARRKMHIVERDGQWRIEGPGAERAKLAFAKAGDGRLQYEVDFSSTSGNISGSNSRRVQVAQLQLQ